MVMLRRRSGGWFVLAGVCLLAVALAPGDYAVIVEPGDSEDSTEGDEDAEGESVGEGVRAGLPARYQNEETSGLNFTVTDSGPNEFPIELTTDE